MDEPDAVVEPVVPSVASLRRPRSPISGNGKEYYNTKYQPKNQKEDSGSEKGHVKKFMPPGHNPPPQKSSSPNHRGGRGGGRGGGGARNYTSRAPQKDNANDDEDWTVKPATQQDVKPKQPFTSPVKAQPSPPVQACTVTPTANQATPPVNQATPPVNQATAPANQATAPVNQATPPSNKAIPSAIKSPISIDNVTPVRKGVPKNCIMDVLPCDAVALLSVEAADEVKGSWVCVSISEQYAAQYDALLGDLSVACEAAATTVQALNPALGATFCLFNSADGGWYRARRLSPNSAAFLDAGKVVPMSESDKCSKLPAEFEATPEFCCTLISDTAKIGQNLKCTIVCKSLKDCKASIEDCETGVALGECGVQRWRPTVEYCTVVARENATGQCHSREPVVQQQVPISPPSALPAAPVQPVIPEVPRPDVIANSRVVLVDMTAFDRAYVRPVDVAVQKKFDLVLEDVLMYGRTATPLTEPPQKGQVVVAKYSVDGLHYRALVKRTNVKQDKYQLEYIEYGNIAVSSLENIYACPPEMNLQNRPTMTSQVTLQVSTEHPLTPAAINFIETIKETELILTLPCGARTTPSGSAVVLTVAKDGQNLNKKLEEMCAPEWKKIEERGGDVIESEVLMLTDLEHIDLPVDGCQLDVLDVSTIHRGTIYVCPKELPHAAHVLGPLTQKIADYCNSKIGRQPYLPKDGELCIAQCPPYPQWFRGLVLEQVDGAGGQLVKVWYIDYGNAEDVPVSLVRKMLPEFVRGLPPVASTAKLKGFPEEPTQAQCLTALEHMQLNEEGRGTLVATRCQKVADEPGWYTVEVPALIAAINGVRK